MLVYGDHDERAEAAEVWTRLVHRREAAEAEPDAFARRVAREAFLIELGRLAQGWADRRFDPELGEAPDAVDRALMRLLTETAGSLLADRPAPRLPALALSGEVSMRSPEGYGFYGLYPTAYAAAASALSERGAGVRLIGLRSIGVSLAAVVAAALDVPDPISVRPFGPPFQRQVRLAPAALAELLRGAGSFVVVDEGPGLSGSSAAAVVRMLFSAGVKPASVCVITGHGGAPGAAASAEVRQLWTSVRRLSAEVHQPSDAVVAGWSEPLIGASRAAPTDLSGGRWRSLRLPDAVDWPGVDPRTDRRKVLLTTRSGRWLARFVGLGAAGEARVERARLLSSAGLIPEVRGVARGFLIQRWVPSVGLVRPGPETVGRYLATRTARLGSRRQGASLGDLRDMALHNVGEALGAWARGRLADQLIVTPALEAAVRPAAIDGRLDRWTWLKGGNGELLKADAVEHEAGHDLIGPQDLAWDVIGAETELELDPSRLGRLLRALRTAGGPVSSADLLAFYRPCYLAFRLGAATLAASCTTGAEAARRHRAAERYADRLAG